METQSLKKKILVIGDLFIDENWLMSRCNNYHSTNVGDFHFTTLLQEPRSLILSLCGVGSVLKILYGPHSDYKDPIKIFDLVGISTWNTKDTGILKCILCPEMSSKKAMNPFTLTGLEHPDKDKLDNKCVYDNIKKCTYDICMMNLIKENDTEYDSSTTSRLYRVYEGFGSDQPKLRYRFDWQQELPEDKLDINKIKEFKAEDIEAIIIVDHGKGIISSSLIKLLVTRFSKAKWYIRTKLSSPEWLLELKKGVEIRLLVADQQLVQHKYGIRVWKHGSILGRGSLEILGNILGLATYKHGEEQPVNQPRVENTAILFEDNSAIAGSRLNVEEDALICYVPHPSGEKKIIQTGRTSVFFTSLIYWDLYSKDDRKLNDKTICSATKYAIDTMYQWTEECTKAWIAEKPDKLSGPFDSVITWRKPHEYKIEENGQKYKSCWEQWNESSGNLGYNN